MTALDTAPERYAALIATVQPAVWWTERRYRDELDAIRPCETREAWNLSIHWDDAVRLAVARFRAECERLDSIRQPSPQTGDLFGGEI